MQEAELRKICIILLLVILLYYSIYMISGELEIVKQKGLLSDNNTVRASYKDAWITFLFVTRYRSLF